MSVLADKSMKFAIRIVKLSQYLRANCKEDIIAKQVLRSGTSIGANISEANYAQSKADFVSKMQIALKEAAETEYWLKLLCNSDCINKVMYQSLSNDCIEIKRMLVSTINTSKE